jgi:hypothetical protein
MILAVDDDGFVNGSIIAPTNPTSRDPHHREYVSVFTSAVSPLRQSRRGDGGMVRPTE